jgi:hypothetical protein
MIGTALHVQASLWKRRRSHERDLAVLVMEGEAADRTNGGAPVEDALFRVALAKGLALATDLDHLDLRPVRGWRVVIDEAGTVTVEWPQRRPLLSAAPVDLPPGWVEAATDLGLVVVIAGHGLGLSGPGSDLLTARLARAAYSGDVAAGMIGLKSAA